MEQTPRILRTAVQIWKDGKKLYWYKGGGTPLTGDSIATNLTASAQSTTFLALLDPTAPNLYGFLNSPKAQEYVILLLVREIILDTRFPKTLKNILCIEEIPQIYSHIPKDTYLTEESVVKLFAKALRFTCVTTDPPPDLWLITQYYEAPSKRRREIQYCLKKNLENPLIGKVVLLNEKIYDRIPPTATQVDIHRRLQYSDVFKYIYETVPSNTIVVFANSDIFFDDTLRFLWNINLSNKFLALLRYDIEIDAPLTNAKIFGPRPDSQDSWVILSDSVKACSPSVLSNFDFSFGTPGCDNALAYEMLRQKFIVANPAQTIRTYHVHGSGYRTYNKNNIITRPVYLYLEPTPIQEFEIKSFPVATRTLTYQGYTPTTQFLTPNAKAIFLQTLFRGTLNEIPEVPTLQENIVEIENSFQLSSGLVTGLTAMYLEPAAKELWSKQKLSIVAPSVSFEEAVAIPWNSESQDYVLHYLSRVLQIRKPGQGFWGPPDGDLERLKLFMWGESRLPIFDPKQTQQLYCQRNICAPIRSIPYREDVEVLRRYSSLRFNKNTTNTAVIITDYKEDVLVETFFREKGYQVLFSSTPLELNTCKYVIVMFRTTFSLWMCQPGTTVIEFQEDMTPSLDIANLCEISDLIHYIVPLTKALDSKRRADILAALETVAAADKQPAAADKQPVLLSVAAADKQPIEKERTEIESPSQIKFETIFSRAEPMRNVQHDQDEKL